MKEECWIHVFSNARVASDAPDTYPDTPQSSWRDFWPLHESSSPRSGASTGSAARYSEYRMVFLTGPYQVWNSVLLRSWWYRAGLAALGSCSDHSWFNHYQLFLWWAAKSCGESGIWILPPRLLSVSGSSCPCLP